jgi:hypothetical protein
MSGATYIATIVSVAAFMLGAVIAIVVFIGGSLGSRMDRLEARMDSFEGHVDGRFAALETVVQALREDVAVL